MPTAGFATVGASIFGGMSAAVREDRTACRRFARAAKWPEGKAFKKAATLDAVWLSFTFLQAGNSPLSTGANRVAKT
ncbi:MAG: hypothetical protein HOC72_18415 [Rhodospirillaceae bacterium]|nr:hypothetical protein [Rhodospirillaceae bacterium]